MNIELRERTAWHVERYFERTRDPEVRRFLPQKAATAVEALEEFQRTQGPDSTSFGRTIYADGEYVGDIWCYGIQREMPNAMVSYCVFEKSRWGMGIGGTALKAFLAEIKDRFGIKSLGAFTFAENGASIRVLERNGFTLRERFSEDGVESVYLQLEME